MTRIGVTTQSQELAGSFDMIHFVIILRGGKIKAKGVKHRNNKDQKSGEKIAILQSKPLRLGSVDIFNFSLRHPERSEGSALPKKQILRQKAPQNDAKLNYQQPLREKTTF